MGWFVARHASRTRLLAVAYLEKSRRREGKFNDSSEKIENFPLGKALQCLHPRQVGKLLNDLHQESLTATSSHEQVLFFNNSTINISKINIEIKVERVVDFLLLHRRWFDTPALKLLLSLVPDIESLFLG